ncbi:uncharacterized protein [Watersipora subatra]|uniref:uncharacterized protein n=1 Tax=Watersipora subatra TaxID=2589382 RepID=UPI00355C706E
MSVSPSIPNGSCRIYPAHIEMVRESIFLDKRNHSVPMSQVMPKYIPKEPTKAYASSSGPRSHISSRTGSVLLSEFDSDVGSVQSTARRPDSPTYSQLRRKRLKSKTKRKGKAKSRPVNVVGPIISSFTNSSEDKDEALSGSGVESGESDTDRVRLEEDLVASGKLVTKLQHDLSNQLKVNSELKKLLVASVGNDLQYRVEKLAQDKVELSATVGSYSQKIYKDVEDLDRISIQADMWRSKYMASRVQADELTQVNLSLNQRYTEATSALQQMLEERRTINNNLQLAQRLLERVHSPISDSLSRTSMVNRSTLQMSDDVLAISNRLANSLPTQSSPIFQSDPTFSLTHSLNSPEVLSPSESAAYDVLSDQLIPTIELEVPHTDDIPRMSSIFCQTRSSKKCARKDCKNEIIVV